MFALLPFACGCPVWLYSIKYSLRIHLQLLSNTFRAAWEAQPSYSGSSWLLIVSMMEAIWILESTWRWKFHAVTIIILVALVNQRCSQTALVCALSNWLFFTWWWNELFFNVFCLCLFSLDAAWQAKLLALNQQTNQDLGAWVVTWYCLLLWMLCPLSIHTIEILSPLFQPSPVFLPSLSYSHSLPIGR